MRIAVGWCVAAASVALPSAALADGRAPSIEVGWRTGLALPMGDALGAPGGQKALLLGDVVTAALPLWIDAGFRLDRHVYVGADFQYARALVSTRQGCPVPGVNCSAADAGLGVQVHYRPMPARGFYPWAGLGVGYEILGVSGQPSGGSFSGWQLGVQGGGDYEPSPSFRVGLFVALALDAFSACNSSTGAPCRIDSVGLHEWLTIGVRGAYDVHVGG